MGNLFIIGAGFDRAFFGGKVPLNDELFDWLNSKATYPAAKEAQEKYKTNNVELIFTYLQLEISNSKRPAQGISSLETTRNWIVTSIASFFREFRFNENLVIGKGWPRQFCNDVLGEHDVLVSLNYSCCLDGLLDYFNVWHPNGGYGKYLENMIFDIKPSHPIHNKDLKNILLLKVHGSEHFQQIEYVDKKGKTYISFPYFPDIYPSAKYSNFEAGTPSRGPYIIAPSYIKTWHPQLELTIIDSLRAAEGAHHLIIIGCSLRTEDSYLWLLISAFIKADKNDLQERKIVIIDPDAVTIRDKIVEHYGFIEQTLPKLIILIPRKFEDSVTDLKKVLCA